jgi:hypothetical protein
MRPTGIAAIGVLLLLSGTVRAEASEAERLLQQVDAFVHSLIDWPAPRDHEVIAPPGDIDAKMAIVPRSGGVMRVIPAPDRPQQR